MFEREAGTIYSFGGDSLSLFKSRALLKRVRGTKVGADTGNVHGMECLGSPMVIQADT